MSWWLDKTDNAGNTGLGKGSRQFSCNVRRREGREAGNYDCRAGCGSSGLP